MTLRTKLVLLVAVIMAVTAPVYVKYIPLLPHKAETASARATQCVAAANELCPTPAYLDDYEYFLSLQIQIAEMQKPDSKSTPWQMNRAQWEERGLQDFLAQNASVPSAMAGGPKTGPCALAGCQFNTLTRKFESLPAPQPITPATKPNGGKK